VAGRGGAARIARRLAAVIRGGARVALRDVMATPAPSPACRDDGIADALAPATVIAATGQAKARAPRPARRRAAAARRPAGKRGRSPGRPAAAGSPVPHTLTSSLRQRAAGRSRFHTSCRAAHAAATRS